MKKLNLHTNIYNAFTAVALCALAVFASCSDDDANEAIIDNNDEEISVSLAFDGEEIDNITRANAQPDTIATTTADFGDGIVVEAALVAVPRETVATRSINNAPIAIDVYEVKDNGDVEYVEGKSITANATTNQLVDKTFLLKKNQKYRFVCYTSDKVTANTAQKQLSIAENVLINNGHIFSDTEYKESYIGVSEDFTVPAEKTIFVKLRRANAMFRPWFHVTDLTDYELPLGYIHCDNGTTKENIMVSTSTFDIATKTFTYAQVNNIGRSWESGSEWKRKHNEIDYETIGTNGFGVKPGDSEGKIGFTFTAGKFYGKAAAGRSITFDDITQKDLVVNKNYEVHAYLNKTN